MSQKLPKKIKSTTTKSTPKEASDVKEVQQDYRVLIADILNQYGVTILKTNGEFKTYSSIITDILKIWNSFKEDEQQFLNKWLGGLGKKFWFSAVKNYELNII